MVATLLIESWGLVTCLRHTFNGWMSACVDSYQRATCEVMGQR